MLGFLMIALLGVTAVQPFALPVKVQTLNTPLSNFTEQAEVAYIQSMYWVSNITIGTPGQYFTMVIDTASANLWVPDVTCGAACNMKSVFNSTTSSTYQGGYGPIYFNDHLGAGSGIVGRDNIVLGTDARAVAVPNALFSQAVTVPPSILNAYAVDGVIGIAFPALANSIADPIMTQAYNKGAAKTEMVVLWFEDQWETDDNGTEGVIYYGNDDPLHCAALRHTYPLSAADYFQFTIPSFSTFSNHTNGQHTNQTTYTVKTQAILASTSPYVSVPPQVATNIINSIGLPSNTLLPAKVPCNMNINFSFNFSQGSELITQLNLVVPRGDGSCQLQMVQSFSKNGDGGKRFEIGFPFLRGRCTYLDTLHQTIGFADAATHGAHTGA